MRYREIAGLVSVKTIEALRPEIAREAQGVYDAWDQSEDAYDEYAGGGICHVIAERVVDVLAEHGVDCTTVSSNHEVHVYVIAKCAEGVFEVDIPYRLYERGGGYTWTKIPDVQFTPDFVHIGHLDSDPERFSIYGGDDDLMEAPIQDIHVGGDRSNDTEFEQGTGFDRTDQKLITRGREHFIRAFRNTPHVFEIYFLNDADINANSESENNKVDDYAEAHGAGIHYGVLGIQGKPGVIRHVQISNLSPIMNRMPMTPWILAHKIAHAIQDSLNDYENRGGALVSDHIKAINLLLNNISLQTSDEPLLGPEDAETSFTYIYFNHLTSLLTMRSAESLSNPFELWAEVVAQYLVEGRVTMRVGPETWDLVNGLNRAIQAMFGTLEGKVLLEV